MKPSTHHHSHDLALKVSYFRSLIQFFAGRNDERDLFLAKSDTLTGKTPVFDKIFSSDACKCPIMATF